MKKFKHRHRHYQRILSTKVEIGYMDQTLEMKEKEKDLQTKYRTQGKYL